MFDKMNDLLAQMQMMNELMKDDNFKAFVAHPKVQELFQDPEFKDIAKSRDLAQITSHPRFMEMARDPEVARLLVKIDPRRFTKS